MRLLWLGLPLVIVGSIVLPAMVGGAYSPTRSRAVRKMLEHARIQPGDVLVDLGVGDGRILLHGRGSTGSPSSALKSTRCAGVTAGCV